jgi:hypothetical protein
MSKQSNQRYRKEKDERLMDKTVQDQSSSTSGSSPDKDKLNYREFNTSSDKTDKG